jgi:hypothetical protein
LPGKRAYHVSLPREAFLPDLSTDGTVIEY